MAAVAVVTTLIVSLSPSVASEQPSGDGIAVTSTHAAGPAMCLPAWMAAHATLRNTPSAWIVRIDAWAPICGPVTAATYRMPSNVFWPWPQRLVHSEALEIGPGVTTITFTKGCNPAQFDVVSGGAPQSIQPVTGPMHGPILYWLPYTGYQHWPSTPCTGTSPSTTTVTTTTSPSATSTTIGTTSTTTVGTTTTTAGVTTTTDLYSTTTSPPETTTTTAPIGVAGEVETPTSGTGRPGAGGANAPSASPTAVEEAQVVRSTGGLALTGTSVGGLIALAFVLLAVGIASVRTARARRRPDPWRLIDPMR